MKTEPVEMNKNMDGTDQVNAPSCFMRRQKMYSAVEIRDKIKEEIMNLKRRPIRVLPSVIMMVIMSFLTVQAWDGIAKRLMICMGLTVLSGFLLLIHGLPNKISVPLLVVYLWFVPVKIFQRMELPTQDMSGLADGAELLTAAFIVAVYLLIFLFTQSSRVALGAGSGAFLVLFLVEYYIWKFRGGFLMPSDLRAVGTAVSVMGNYQYDLSPEAVYSVIYFLFFIVLGSRIRVKMNRWGHAAVSLIGVLYIGGWYYTVMETPAPLGKELEIDHWNVGNTRNIDGACLSYFLLLKENRVELPRGYSEKAVETFAQMAVDEYESAQVTDRRPDIIMIMNEAWSDLRVLGEFETTEEYMPFVDRLTENTTKGDLYVSILGGLTANTEFEALTGNSLSLLSAGTVPYQNQVRHDMPSLARVLENQGYQTIAMHPSGESAWSRNQVYSCFGFDEFIHQGLWEVPYEYVRGFISDECNYKEIIHRYENRDEDAPFFLFDVTIQNHSSYYGEIPLDIDLVSVGGIPAEDVGYVYDVQTYLNLMKISDDALKELTEYFEQVDDPVIICMFGDHQPSLGEDFYNAVYAGNGMSEEEQNLQKYIVPYVIWANYDVDWKEYGEMSANYLPAVLMECAGLDMPPFYRYLAKLREQYPVLTKMGCRDQSGELMNIDDIWDSEPISRYRMFQYDQLYVRDYQKAIFEEGGTRTQ